MFSISSSSCCCVRLLVPYKHVSIPSEAPVHRSSYLERKVLEEVRRAVGLVRLGPGAGVDPHADGRSLRIGRVLSGNL